LVLACGSFAVLTQYLHRQAAVSEQHHHQQQQEQPPPTGAMVLVQVPTLSQFQVRSQNTHDDATASNNNKKKKKRIQKSVHHMAQESIHAKKQRDGADAMATAQRIRNQKQRDNRVPVGPSKTTKNHSIVEPLPAMINDPKKTTTMDLDLDLARAKRLSSVEYFACCGTGHRMSKMVDAHYIAHRKNLGLRITWGWCAAGNSNNHNDHNNSTEVFYYFFGPQPLHELRNVTSKALALKINNESPCFVKFGRRGPGGNTTNNNNNETTPTDDCPCPTDYMKESGTFYKGLRRRFRARGEIDLFRRQHSFANHTVIGLHVRAGNGEEGEFIRKNRGIHNTSAWVQSMSKMLVQLSSQDDSSSRTSSRKNSPQSPPLLFIATDTASIVKEFRRELVGIMPVVDWEQERAAEGTGVVFGVFGSKVRSGCLSNWKNSLMDMMLLSHADVVVAGRPSSFTQSLPMGIVLARGNNNHDDDDNDIDDDASFRRKIRHSYCEVNSAGTEYQCFEDFHDWCCRGRTDFHLGGIRKYEYRRMPRNMDECDLYDHLQRRPRNERQGLASPSNMQVKYAFLPYDWSRIL
jgi:hypothetical protein